MKNYTFIFFIVLTLLTFTFSIEAAEDGGTVAPILSYSAGARAYAMAGANTALVDDSTATFWNPAGLAQRHREEIYLFFESLFAGTSFIFAGYTYPIQKIGVVSGSVMYLGTDNIQSVGENLENLPSFSSYQLLVNVSFAQKLDLYKKLFYYLKYIDAGATVKLFNFGIDNTSKIGAGLDLGLKYYPVHWRFDDFAYYKYVKWFESFLHNAIVAVKFNNFIPPTLKFDEARDWYLWDLNLGIAYRTLYDTLNIELDFSQTLFKKRNIRPKIGAEYTFYRMFKARLGYNGEITAGLGVEMEDFKFDYAYGYNFGLGSLHQISVSYSFGDFIP